MPYIITHDCICCGTCEFGCLNDAIYWGVKVYSIDADRCTDCVGNFKAPRCAEVCPAKAIILDREHRESRDQLLEKWYQLHPGKTPAFIPVKQVATR